MRSMFFSKHVCYLGMLILLMAGVGVGCDSTVEPEPASRTVEGQATDDEGYGKRADQIEGAVVTAANIQADGSIDSLDATATTSASGQYSLEVTNPTPTIVVKAEKEDYTAQTLVSFEGTAESTVEAMPINSETSAEADVYVEAKGSGNSQVTTSDVAVYVNKQLAGQVETGAATTAEVAAAVKASVEAEELYLNEESEDTSEEEVEDGRENKVEAFTQLQAALNSASGTEAEASLLTEFEGSVRDAYVEAGASAEASAKAHQSALSAVNLEIGSVEDSTDALFELQQQAEIMAAVATAQAIEASFEANDASEERLQALADARVQLVNDLRTAGTVEVIQTAKTEYQDAVEAELSAEVGVEAAVITETKDALSSILSTLKSVLTLNASVSNLVSAHGTFYTNAESTAVTKFENNGSTNAQLGAEVITLLTLQ